MANEWTEVTSDSTTGRVVTATNINWSIGMGEYLSTLIQKFGYNPNMDSNYIPSQVYITAVFVTTDKTNA